MCPLFNHFGVYNSMGVNQWLNLSRIYRSAVMKWPRIGFWLIIASWCWLGVSFGCDWIPRWTATALGGRRSKKKTWFNSVEWSKRMSSSRRNWKMNSFNLKESEATAALEEYFLSSLSQSMNEWMNEWMNAVNRWNEAIRFSLKYQTDHAVYTLKNPTVKAVGTDGHFASTVIFIHWLLTYRHQTFFNGRFAIFHIMLLLRIICRLIAPPTASNWWSSTSSNSSTAPFFHSLQTAVFVVKYYHYLFKFRVWVVHSFPYHAHVKKSYIWNYTSGWW